MSGNNPHPTRDELMKQIISFTKPVVDPIVARKDDIKYYFNTVYEHSKRVSPLFNRKYAALEYQTARTMKPFHHYRREMGWEIVTGTTLLVSLASLGFGLQATSRNAVLAACVSTLLVNPEYLYDMYKYYSVPGVTTIDSSNKSSFRW